MQIYSGTVTDVTEEILWTWLLRDVLRGAVELHAGEDGAQRLGCTIADPTNPAERQHYLLAVTRQPYMTRCTFIQRGKSSREQPATDEPMQHAGALQLTQWRASEVNVTLWEEAPGTLTARLQTWLGMNYDCTLHNMQLSPKQEQAFADADADERIRLLRRYVYLAERDSQAPLEVVASTLSNEKGEAFSERQLRQIRDEIRRETGQTVWPQRRRGPKGRRSR